MRWYLVTFCDDQLVCNCEGKWASSFHPLYSMHRGKGQSDGFLAWWRIVALVSFNAACFLLPFGILVPLSRMLELPFGRGEIAYSICLEICWSVAGLQMRQSKQGWRVSVKPRSVIYDLWRPAGLLLLNSLILLRLLLLLLQVHAADRLTWVE